MAYEPGTASRPGALDQLVRWSEAPSVASVGLAILAGSRGTGREVVLRHFTDQIRSGGGVVLEGACEAVTPHGPLVGVVEAALAAGAEVGGSDIPRGLACAAGCHALWYDHSGPDARTSPKPNRHFHRAHLVAIAELIGDLSRRRTIALVLHDLELADPETRELLELLLEGAAGFGARCSIVATACVEAQFGDLEAHPDVTRVPVGNFDVHGLRALLASDGVLARILARTGGAPAAIERLLAAEPPSADALLASRRARLPVRAQRALALLAVAGGACARAALAQLAGGDAIVALAERGLTRERAGGRVAFADAADAPRVLASLDGASRDALHLAWVEHWLERAPARAELALPHVLARGQLGRAGAILDDAIDALIARHAHGHAAELLRDLIGQAGPGAAPAWRGRLADLLAATGEHQAALGEARAAYRASPSDPSAARLARTLLLAGELDEACRWLERLTPQAGCDEAPSLRAALAEALYQAGRPAEARRHAELLVGELDGTEHAVDAELEARQTLAKLTLAEGAFERGLALYHSYEARAATLRQPRHLALAVGGAGVAYIRLGRLDDAEAALGRCFALADAADSHKGRALGSLNLAVVSHLRHDYGAARARYERALGYLRVVGNRASLGRIAFNLGQLYETMGDLGRARSMCDVGDQVGGAAPGVRAEGLLLRARIELACLDADAAELAFEAAWSSYEGTDPVRGAAALFGLCRVALLRGDVEAAERQLGRVKGPLCPERTADRALARAQLAIAQGHPQRGGLTDAAIVAAEATEDEALLLAALLLGAKVHRAADDGAAEGLVARARALDESMGARVPEDLAAAWAERPARAELRDVSRARPSAAPRDVPAPTIVGRSGALRRVLHMVERVAPTRCTVLITGESGTGKELVAEAVHLASPRSAGPLVRLNCAALVDGLLLSELFGHERGAFTGAHQRRRGRFELADGGTLFLDEIGDISPAVQGALLRVLQERTFERVGGTQTVRVDVRIVAATNRDLPALVRSGAFREDLYYRLNEVALGLPSLRDRGGDIALLSRHFLERVAEERDTPLKELSPEALAALEVQPWRGNVRELHNALRAASLFCEGEVLRPEHFELKQAGALPVRRRPAPGDGVDEVDVCYRRLRQGELTLKALKKDLERRLIERALAEAEGTISVAADLLGMKRPRLSQLVKEYGLRPTGADS